MLDARGYLDRRARTREKATSCPWLCRWLWEVGVVLFTAPAIFDVIGSAHSLEGCCISLYCTATPNVRTASGDVMLAVALGDHLLLLLLLFLTL